MKAKILSVTLLLGIGLIKMTIAQQLTFQKTYGGGANETGNSVQQTTDGGYIIAGTTESYGVKNGYYDVYLVKTDINGDTLWTRAYGGAVYDEGYSVHQTSDLGYIVVGHTSSFGNGGFDVYLIRTDMNGNLLWSKTYGGTSDDDGYDVKQTTDGGFIITGQTLNFGAINHDVYLIKTDADGNLLWTRTFGGTGDDYGYSVQQTKDGGYIVGGNRSTAGFYIIKTNSAGDTLWTKTSYAGTTPHINVAYSIKQTDDEGYIIAGITYPLHVLLIKTNSNGTTQWSKIIAGAAQDYALSVGLTTNGGYIIGGWTMSFPVGSYHSMLIRTDATGEIIWTKTYSGGGSSPVGYSVQQAADGGFIFLGSATGLGAGLWDMYLVKTDENGNTGSCLPGTASPSVTSVTTISKPTTTIGTGGIATTPVSKTGRGGIVTTLCTTVGIYEIMTNNSLVVYPNPFTNEIIIKGTKQNGVIILFDGNGKEIMRERTSDGETKLNTQVLISGYYLLNYILEKKSTSIKLIKF
jgi:hypothetical protein